MDVLAHVSEATGVPADLLGGYIPVLTAAASTGRLPGRDAVEALRASGTAAAERGVPLRAVADACLLAAELTVRATCPADASVLGAVRRAVAAYADGYEHAQLRAIREEENARREFVDDLLQGRADRLAERAAHFGLRLAEAYVVAVARDVKPIEDGDPLLRRVEHALVTRFGSHNILVAVRDGLLVCVTPASLGAAVGEFTHHVRGNLGSGWRIGVGRSHRGPGGVVTSFREAGEAIGLGDRLGLLPQVLKAADLLVFPVLLRDREAIDDLVATVLGPLTGARGGPAPLLETLEAVFAAQGNQTAAARRLGVSTRAVTYRLERIRRLTGFSPDDPTQRFTLETAVMGARLLGWPAPEQG
ncbi:helix-turn-helix domain-containing protein [Sphaerisporangium sp. TRM90804]|uniref:PucR family transcriptional regulator n=1 Tax=Sphaerisporangium sp. TRM90804 TaxID=3031113 RepID=UPI00244AB4B4|nr:helix-turn-helix domain-containing protein [Sphaerisporangium sp. TRM90804]MDH2429700.1 helix-turn-helix domain-containing protein [Sphaerisporangium sp. TRM90804]